MIATTSYSTINPASDSRFAQVLRALYAATPLQTFISALRG